MFPLIMKGENMSETKVNFQHKDRLFKKVFSKKEDLLSLYNAINDTAYDDPEMIEINTIDNFIFMGMKNDVSCIIANVMNLYEQQSTINPNMPLRGFLYQAELYRKLFGNHTDLYSSRLIELPKPQFIVFYNGTDDEPDEKIMSMSDAYVGEAKYAPSIECTAILLNINYGHNRVLMEKCKQLYGYSILIHRVRENIKSGMDKSAAVTAAVNSCISDNILRDILEQHVGEATAMILEEYNEDLHIKNEKEISYYNGDKDGFARGDKQGFERGKKQGQDSLADTIKRLKNGDSVESILADGIDEDTIELAKQCL